MKIPCTGTARDLIARRVFRDNPGIKSVFSFAKVLKALDKISLSRFIGEESC